MSKYKHHPWLVLWPRKGSLMKTQTRILDNRLYYTRNVELHRKGKKSRTVRITPILICGICCSLHITGMCGTRPFLGGSDRRAGAHTRPAYPKIPTAPSAFPLLGAPGDDPPESGKSLGEKAPWSRRKSPGTETHSARSVPQIIRPAEVLPGNWSGSDRYWYARLAAKSLRTNNDEKSPLCEMGKAPTTVGYGRKVNGRQAPIVLLLSLHVHNLIRFPVNVPSTGLTRFWPESFPIFHPSSLPWTSSSQECNQMSTSRGTTPFVQPSQKYRPP